MASTGGSGRGIDSHMAAVAKRRATVQATRKRLNIGQENGVAATNVRGRTPPVSNPDTAKNPPAPTQTPEQAQADQQTRMRQQTSEFFQKVARPNAVPVPDQGQVDARPPQPSAASLTQQIETAQAGGMSSEQQFYRISGRLPSPREMAVFQTALMLERQLGRKPTRNELKATLTRPDLVSPAFPAAVEV